MVRAVMKRVGFGLTVALVALALVAPACADDGESVGDSSGTGGTSGSGGTPNGGGSNTGGSGGTVGGAGGSPSFEIDCETLCENAIECAASAGMAGAGGDGPVGPDLGECVRSCESSVSTLPGQPCGAEAAEFMVCSATVEPDATVCIDGMMRHDLVCVDEFDAVIACEDE
jgi:hypothetical protein